MTLSEIAAGSSVFIDANILIYHFADRSRECTSFLVRIAARELLGYVGPAMVLEVAHRLMVYEALELGVTTAPNPAARLSRNRQAVKQLSRYYFSILRLPEMGIEVLSLPEDFMQASQEFRQTHGLMVNDSLVPMHMRSAGLSILASADTAFDGLPGIRRFAPADV